MLHKELFAPGSTGEQLWDLGLVSRLLAAGSLAARTAGLLAVIETPQAIEAYILRAQGQDDAKRRAQRCIEAVQEASRFGWAAVALLITARARAKKAGSPYPAAPALSLDQSKDGEGKKEIPPACVKSSSAF